AFARELALPALGGRDVALGILVLALARFAARAQGQQPRADLMLEPAPAAVVDAFAEPARRLGEIVLPVAQLAHAGHRIHRALIVRAVSRAAHVERTHRIRLGFLEAALRDQERAVDADVPRGFGIRLVEELLVERDRLLVGRLGARDVAGGFGGERDRAVEIR